MKKSSRSLHPTAGEARRRRRPLSGMTFAAAGLGAILEFTFPGTAFAAESDPFPTITVRVYNSAQASPALLSRAEHEAGRILGEAGFELGHLLLGTNDHSRMGIMQARWYPDQFLQLMKGKPAFNSHN